MRVHLSPLRNVEDLDLASDVPRPRLAAQVVEVDEAKLGVLSSLHREMRLRGPLHAVRDRFDFIFIDTPPSLGLLTLNALSAADAVLVPLQCEYYALEGLSDLQATVALVGQHLNPGLDIEGIVLCMVDTRQNLTEQVATEVRGHFGNKVYTTTIPRNVRLSEAPSFGKPALLYDVSSRGARSYLDLAREFLARQDGAVAAAAQDVALAGQPTFPTAASPR